MAMNMARGVAASQIHRRARVKRTRRLCRVVFKAGHFCIFKSRVKSYGDGQKSMIFKVLVFFMLMKVIP
jgi:hypothetical protein